MLEAQETPGSTQHGIDQAHGHVELNCQLRDAVDTHIDLGILDGRKSAFECVSEYDDARVFGVRCVTLVGDKSDGNDANAPSLSALSKQRQQDGPVSGVRDSLDDRCTVRRDEEGIRVVRGRFWLIDWGRFSRRSFRLVGHWLFARGSILLIFIKRCHLVIAILSRRIVLARQLFQRSSVRPIPIPKALIFSQDVTILAPGAGRRRVKLETGRED